MKLKKVLAILLALVTVLMAFAACGTPDKPDEPKEYTGEMVENGNTYADPNWMPVVKNPITVSAIIRDPLIAGNVFSERTIWKEFGETTGVHLDLQVTTSVEPEQLMFASRNYPDIAFRIYVDEMQNQAAYAGDILELTDSLLETYAPNWYQVFTENPEIYKMTLLPDGKLYFLPMWFMEENSYMLRDCFWINDTWLDEVGLEMPKTTEDYINYLRAVKNAAGTGSIPENAVPLFIRMYMTPIGGYYNVMDWFGVYNGFASEIIVDGKVTHQALNPNLKPAIKYMAQLYQEGLVNENCLSVTWTEYQEAIGNSYDGASTPWVGSFFSYSISDAMKGDYSPCGPLNAGTDEGPYVHDFGAHERIIDNALSIFSHSKYPIAILRAFDYYATGENAVRALVGEQGQDKQWFKQEDGTFLFGDNAWNLTDNTNAYGWNDTAPGVVYPEITNQLMRNRLKDTDSREYAYEYIYKDYLPDDMSLYITDATNYLTPDEASQAQLVWTRTYSVIQTFTKRWITGKSDIDDEWDAFQMALKNNGLFTRLELFQKAWDAYTTASIE